MKLQMWAIWTCSLVAIDQITKALVRFHLSLGERVPVLDGFLYIAFLPNTRGYTWFVPKLPDWVDPAYFVLRVLILVLAYPVYAFSTQSGQGTRWAWLALIGISAGTLGNMVDNLFVPFTTDFLQVGRSPTANFADIYSYIGIVALVIEIAQRWMVNKPRWRGIRYHWKALIEQKRAFIHFLGQYLRKMP